MSSRLPLVVSVTALALPAAAFAIPQEPGKVVAAAQPGATSVQLLECNTGKRPSRRSAVFRAEMSQIATAERMRLRFSLIEKVGTTRVWSGVTKSEWRNSNPDVTRFAYQQRVVGLKPATKYRMTVTFQWLDGDGEVVAKDSSGSKVCRQRGKLPNLGIRDDVRMRQARTPGTYRYAVKIHNNGPARSPRTKLRLTVDGAEVDARPIGRLRSGERRLIRFVGPACRKNVRAEIDPGGVVREITEKDNVRITGCSVTP